MPNQGKKPKDFVARDPVDGIGLKGVVLVVDDVKLMRMSLCRVLKSAGYTVFEAEDGTQALAMLQLEEMLRFQDMSLVIADIRMPDMDGLEMVEQIRANPKTANLPVLMCTGTKRKSEIIQAARLGIQGFLVKPVSPASLLTKVEEIFAAVQRSYKGKSEASGAIDI